ncbi:MAG TPA: S53 family peptidase [Acidobacteriaceae bacterium]|nr:S53 family peptidase [Acidobacteriaceae bacterium]
MSNSNRVQLKGSERTPLAGAQSLGSTDPQQIVEVSVILKRRQALETVENRTQHLSHADYATQYGADPDSIELIRNFAKENNLQVLERGDEIIRRTVTLAGTAAAMEKAFSVELHDYEHPEGTYRGRTGPIHIPQEYAHCIQGVFGLDDRAVAKPHYRYQTARATFGARTTSVSYAPTQVAQAYAFPNGGAAGQTIGIIELGGGYRPADLKTYFHSLGLVNPKIKTVSVDQGKNRPTTANSADGEVMLDIEVAAAVAQGANIVVYFTPNTDRGFQDAISKAIHDQTNKPSVISISWGGPESSWTQAAMESMDQICAEAAALDVTITVASGDDGSSDGVSDNRNHVDFPASSPHVLACGGTNLSATGTTIHSETVWNDGAQGGASGGGISTVFARPSYQSAVVTQPNRGVPDVAGDADPESGYNVRVDGQNMVVGGTSAVAPLWAGLIAVLNKHLNTRLGFINPKLYGINQSAGFHDIKQGNNGAFAARPGWDACTGLGSPDGAGLLHALQTSAAATQTQQPSASKQSISAD